MRVLRETAINGVSAAASVQSSALDASCLTSISAVATFTDSAAAGDIHFEVCNDPTTPVNWILAPAASGKVTVSTGGTVVCEITSLTYQWVRIAWVRSAGAGTVTVNLKASGF
jgi:hypothetical protein